MKKFLFLLCLFVNILIYAGKDNCYSLGKDPIRTKPSALEDEETAYFRKVFPRASSETLGGKMRAAARINKSLENAENNKSRSALNQKPCGLTLFGYARVIWQLIFNF